MQARRFLLGMLAGLLLVPLVLAVTILMLDRLDRLKAPTFSNRATLDEKLRFIRHRDGPSVDLLLLGSSTTLWGVDGEAFERLWPQRTALNVGVRDLKIHQAADLADLYLDLMPDVRDVVMVATLLDFESCAPDSAKMLDHAAARAYAIGETGELRAQFGELDPLGVSRSAVVIADLRDLPATSPDSLHFDRIGSILLDLPRQAVPDLVWRGSMPPPDERCHAALGDLSRILDRRGVTFTLVIAPMRPGYLDAHDPDGTRFARHRARLAAIASAGGFFLVDAHDALALPESAFFDAYHLRAPITRELTEWIIVQLKIRNSRMDNNMEGLLH